jgi:hypothetical protein
MGTISNGSLHITENISNLDNAMEVFVLFTFQSIDISVLDIGINESPISLRYIVNMGVLDK